VTERAAGSAPDRRGTRDVRVAGALLGVGVALTPVLAAEPTVGLVLTGGALLVLLAALWPVGTVAGYIAINPLIAGLDRGALVPNLRLNEVLLVPILGGLALVVFGRSSRSAWTASRHLHRLDGAVVAIALTGSVSTLLWMYARGRDTTTEDLLYALALWKLVVLYVVVRLVLCDVHAVRWALGAIMVSAGLIGSIGVLQALGVGAVIDGLAAFVPAGEGGYELGGNRATSTLGNPIAYGDLMLYAGISAAALALRFPSRARLLWPAAAALALFALASGQASIMLGLVIAGIAFAMATGTVRKVALIGIVFFAGAFAALQPVLARRLASADPSTGLPMSWTGRYGRLENLRRFFWPEIQVDYNWLFGVRTAGRVPGQEFWREWVYIESGYLWALWTGGLVMLVAVLTLLAVTARTGRRLTSSGEPTAGAMGTTLITVAWMLAALLVVDPHLTFRGCGEVLFVLLALGANLEVRGLRDGPLRSAMGQDRGPDGAVPMARIVHAEQAVQPERGTRAEEPVHAEDAVHRGQGPAG
jgi:hypothetical protein